MTDRIHALLGVSNSKASHRTTRNSYLFHLLPDLRVLLRRRAHLHKGVLLDRGVRVQSGNSKKVAGGNGIDDGAEDGPAHLVVLIQDALVRPPARDAFQTVRQSRNVCESACEAQAAPGVAEMCGVAGETDAADAESLGASLVQLVGADVGESVICRFRVAGEDALVVGCLVVEDFLVGHVLVLLVGDSPQAVFGEAGDKVEVVGVDDGVHVVVAELVERVVDLVVFSCGS